MPQSMHRMDFPHPDFHPGLNVTVRDGQKWKKANPGDVLQLFKTGDPDDKPSGAAEVIQAVDGKFDEIPDAWLKFEHSASCRTKEGLKQAMDEAYGPGGWGPVVTVVFFWVIMS